MSAPHRDHEHGRVSVERLVAADPAAIFAVVADPSRHPEIDGSGTVRGPGRGGRQLRLGDSFGMSMKWGVPYSTRNVVVAFEQDRAITWQTLAPAPLHLLFTGRTWSYELFPREGGTLVRETWDTTTEKPLTRALIRSRLSGLTRANMTRTLERLERVVTA